MKVRIIESQAKKRCVPAQNEVFMNKYVYTVKH